MPYRACPLLAAFVVVLVGRHALVTPSQPASSFGYRVTGTYPVVVRAQPVWGAFVLGTVAPGSIVAGVTDDAMEPAAEFRHIMEPDGDGWVLAADLTPEYLYVQQAGDGFERTFRAECSDLPADCVGP